MSTSTVGEVMITEEQIRTRAAEIGKEISEEFKNENILVVGILKGAVLWMADVVKNIDNENLGIDFMVVSSYGSSTKSSGVVKIVKDLDSDIAGRNAKAVRICTLLDKPEGRRVELEADYIGFTVPDRFIVGYGLDFDQKYRQLPYISFLK